MKPGGVLRTQWAWKFVYNNSMCLAGCGVEMLPCTVYRVPCTRMYWIYTYSVNDDPGTHIMSDLPAQVVRTSERPTGGPRVLGKKKHPELLLGWAGLGCIASCLLSMSAHPPL